MALQANTHIAHEIMIKSCYLMATSDIRERSTTYIFALFVIVFPIFCFYQDKRGIKILYL